MKRKTKRPARAIAVFSIVICASVVAALAAYVKLTPADKAKPSADTFADQAFEKGTIGSGTQVKHDQKGPFSQTSIILPVAKFENDKLTFGESKADVPSGQNAAVFSVNEFLKQSGVADGPVKLESVKLDGHVALLYFNAAFTDQSLGSQDEATLINGIRAVMGQFQEVDEVEFFADGQQVQELGHLELIGPQKVIRPGLWKNPTSHDGTTPIEPQG